MQIKVCLSFSLAITGSGPVKIIKDPEGPKVTKPGFYPESEFFSIPDLGSKVKKIPDPGSAYQI